MNKGTEITDNGINDIVLEYQNGNESHNSDIYYVAYNITKAMLINKYPNTHTEDDISDIIYKVFNKIKKYKPINFKNWVYTLGKNHMVDKERKNSRKVNIIYDSDLC